MSIFDDARNLLNNLKAKASSLSSSYINRPDPVTQMKGMNGGIPQVRQAVQNVANYFSPAAQNKYVDYFFNKVTNIPRYELPQQLPGNFLPVNTNNKTLNFFSGIGRGIIESPLNIPRNLLVGNARIQNEKLNLMRGRGFNVGNAVAGAGNLVEAGLDLSGIPIGKAIGSQAIRNTAKEGAWNAIKRGAAQGAAIGAVGGAAYGTGNQYNQKFNLGEVAMTTAGGALLGGAFGGGIVGLGSIKRNTTYSPQLLEQLRDRKGRWMKGENPVWPKGVTPSQKAVMLQVNEKLGRSPFDPVYPSDLQQAIDLGLSVRAKGGTQAILDAQAQKSAQTGFKDVTGKAPVEIRPRGRKQITQSQLEQGPLIPVKQPEVPLAGGEISPSNRSITQSSNPTDPYFNVEKLNINKGGKVGLKQVVEESKPQIEAFTGKKLSNKEAIGFADRTSKTLGRAVSREETLAWEAKMLKARQLLASQAQSGKLTPEYIDNLVAIKSQGTDIARKLQSLGIGADAKDVTAKDAILEAVLKVTDDADKILKEAKNVDFNNYEQAANFYRKFVKPTAGDWLDKVRYSSMLSSPTTHMVNFSSNLQGTGIIAPIEKTITGGIDWLHSSVTGKPRQYFAGEGIEYAKGYYSNIGNAAKRFADTMRGKSFSTKQEMYNLPLTEAGTTGRKVENALTFFPKLLQSVDEFFQVLTKGGATKALEYKIKKGANVTNVATKVEAESLKRLFNAPFNLKEEGYVLKALEYLPMKVAEARQSTNPVVATIAKYTFPFVRIPSNILKASVEYGPAGITTLWGASNKTEQLSKAILGTSIGLGTALLVSSDRLTWGEPTDPTKRAAFRAAGMQPYAVKIGNKWVSYAKLHPALAFNMALVAALRDAQANDQLDDNQVETVMSGLAKWWGFYADMSYVKNIGDFVSSAKGDLEGVSRWISNYPQQLIPFRALMGWVARIVDPYQRQVDPNGNILQKQLQQIGTQIPWVSKSLPARTTQFGTPIENQNRFVNAISPNKVTTENTGYAKIYRLRENITRYNRVETEVKNLLQQGKREEALKLILKNKQEMTMGKASKTLIDKINKYNDYVKKVNGDQRLTPEQKQKVLKLIEAKIMEIVGQK